jgi:hypothetical protein
LTNTIDQAGAPWTIDACEAYNGRSKWAGLEELLSFEQAPAGEVSGFCGPGFVHPFAVALGIDPSTGGKEAATRLLVLLLQGLE